MNKGLVLIAALTVVFTCQSSAQAKDATFKGVSDTTIVNAPKELVWAAVTSADKFDADIRSAKGEEAIVAQRFERIPFYGTVHTTLKITVRENEELSYELIESDKVLKEMSGGWHLTPIDHNKTKLKLTSSVDPGLPIPRFLINRFIKGKVQGRLNKTRKIAEELYETQRKSEISQKVTEPATNNTECGEKK
jgi:hypothetical protein